MPHLTLPVDAAFEDLAEEMGLESVDTLLEDDNVRKLADVLKYHGERTKLFLFWERLCWTNLPRIMVTSGHSAQKLVTHLFMAKVHFLMQDHCGC